MPPTSDDQIRFLVNLQRLLEEGLFVASYKFALLLSLADLAIERGDDSGAPLPLTVEQIAEKFIRYYWRQAVPYTTPQAGRVLQQNTGKQAAVLSKLADARRRYGDSLAGLMKRPEWKDIVREVGAVVRVMPLWKLQIVGGERFDFLYENLGFGGTIELRPGIAYCFRKFHGLISDLARGAWVRFVRQQNLEFLGETADLNEFLFGSERASLAVVRPVLMELQHGACFYCGSNLTAASTHVDHFIAWARYAIDLGHNFVLADSRCNSKKRDRLPAYNHLSEWTDRNGQYGEQIRTALEQRGMVCQLGASNRVAAWAYAQTEAAGGLTWLRADEMVPLDGRWRELL
jgi:5-methylcytosine-specific restriction endonuclease McrA